MIEFDRSQRRVLELDPRMHARVVGAPGSGKTRLLIESFARITTLPGFADEQVLVLTSGRLPASRLRLALEQRVNRVIGGTPVRTPSSFAFAVLTRERAVAGDPAPRLLTGPAHDEAIARVIHDGSLHQLSDVFAQDVFTSERFRAEVREFSRVLDDLDISVEAARALFADIGLRSGSNSYSRDPDPSLLERWNAALSIVAMTEAALREHRPGEFTSSSLLRAAARTIRESSAVEAVVPRLILIDDAQHLGEGDLALIAACAERGSRVWSFGDPDTAVGAFRGARVALLSRLTDELARRGASSADPEQSVVLSTVYRHGVEMRELVRTLTTRIGAVGMGAHRAARAATEISAPAISAPVIFARKVPETNCGARTSVEFARVSSPAEQLGALAYRLRARRLAVDGGDPVPWSQMAVICRSRGEVLRAAKLLAERQIPTGVTAGGLVLREHSIVRDLVVLLQDSMEVKPIDATALSTLLSGPIGGLDPVSIRRLRSTLLIEERRNARSEGRTPQRIDEMLLEGVNFPGDRPIIDSAAGRAIRRIGRIVAAGRRVHAAGGSARETLWALWEATGLADRWQDEALSALGSRSDVAHRSLDAVVALFFRLQRHEEQVSAQPIESLLSEVLTSTVPEDSLASGSVRDEITVTTAEGASGQEFSVVCVLGPQDGVWPNLRAQGSLLGVGALERWLLGGEAILPQRRETMHDELRQFALACSRATHELLVLSILDDDHHPGPFFGLGLDFERTEPLPSSRLTLRGAVAEMRRRVVLQPDDREARDSLVALAREQIPGAQPDDWYGVRPLSSDVPLVDLDSDPDAYVSASPSQLERVEECGLGWVLERLGAGKPNTLASLGTLLHGVLEAAPEGDFDAMVQAMRDEWNKLSFDAEWESQRAFEIGTAMVRGVSDYLAEFEASGRRLLGSEAEFSVRVGRAELRGSADRLELRPHPDGEHTVSILDLKSGKTKPTAQQLTEHAQLQAYQLGLLLGGFGEVTGQSDDFEMSNGGARLLYVHPEAATNSTYVEVSQKPLSDEQRETLVARISRIAETMAGARFTAQVEHHCTNKYRFGACKLHIIPAVSAG